jgi:aromatic ring-opening dioxygenase catalytic subunit (LigB family)
MLAAWEQAPAARQCHPREEHLLPMMVAAGAAATDTGKLGLQDTVMGISISGYRFG